MPTVDETTALQELLETIRIGGPVSHGALTVGKAVHAAALIVEDRVVHVMAFNGDIAR